MSEATHTQILPEYLTTIQAAQFVGIAPKTLRNWLSNDCCPFGYTPLNGKKMFAVKELRAYMEAHRVAPAAEIKKSVAA